MRNFAKTLSNFLTELKNNILKELTKSNPTYREMKSDKEAYYKQLQDLAPSPLLSEYVKFHNSLADFEVKYCYLRGWTHKKNTGVINPTGSDILLELSDNEKYKQLQSKVFESHDELKSAITPENNALLDKYVQALNEISGLEKHYCYSGGINDKVQFEIHLDQKNAAEWDKFCSLFL